MPFPASYRYLICPTCQHKRRCTAVGLPDFRRQWTCSKGHAWIIDLPSMERVVEVQKAIYTPEKLQTLFEPSPLLHFLRGPRLR